MNKLLADFLVAVHLGYVAFAVVGQVLILIGLARRWHWVRNLRFRVIHLVMVEAVALEGVFNIKCPLTDLEDELRRNSRLGIAAAIVAPQEYAQREVSADDAVDEELDFQPVFQQAEPGVAVFPVQQPGPTRPAEPPAENPDQTFVGWLLGSLLYVSVDQATLDKWYVVFGIVTLIIFITFPPRLGTWTAPGFTGMILVWLGALFELATVYDIYLTQWPISDHKPPLVLGGALIILGLGCGLAARRARRQQPAQM